MHLCRSLFLMMGKACLGLIFVLAGLHKVLKWDETKVVYMNILHAWDKAVDVPSMMLSITDFLMMHDGVFLGIAAGLELVGGLMVFLGIKSNIGALFLIIFLIPITILAHPFWIASGVDAQIQYLMFMKNFAILGGLIVLMASYSPKKV